jgi:hypothetical protein
MFLQSSEMYLCGIHYGAMMTKHQKLVVAVGAFLILVMGIFPPWIRTDRFHARRSSGYAFILQEPRRAVDDLLSNAPIVYSVDFSQLTLQWTLVLVMMGIILLFEKMRRDALEDRATLRPRRT